MLRAVYAIRHQSAGIITSTLYVEPPSDEEIARVASRHGYGWARVVPLALHVPDHAHALCDYLDEVPTEPATPPAPAGFPRVQFRATGTITPPTGAP
jgi:hypothetical protein